MLIVVLVLCVVGWTALATAVVTENGFVGWVTIAACLVGLTMLIVDLQRTRQRRDVVSLPTTDVPPFGRHISDYAASARPAHDAPIHDDHEIERDVVREEWVLHPDTGPLEPDVSAEEANETMRRFSYGRWTHNRDH
jgi:hypothetical protein